MAANRPMLAVFAGAGFGVQRHGEFGEVTVTLDITPSEPVTERNRRPSPSRRGGLRAPDPGAVLGGGGGASDAVDSLAGAVLANILEGGYRGVVTPVNPSGGLVHSIPAAPGLSELEQVPELAIAAVGPDQAAHVASEAAEAGAKALLLLPVEDREDETATWERGEELLEIVRAGACGRSGRALWAF